MTQFPDTLKSWRQTRRFSQLDLALEADVSARHISFLETGRARPSPDMIARLSDALQVPLAARNQMLAHAGFAAKYPGRAWDADEMAPVREALAYMLDKHAPYPGMVIDRLWRVKAMNTPALALFSALDVGVGDSLLELMMSERFSPHIENWPQVAQHAAARLRTESAAQGGVKELDDAATFLAQIPAPNDASTAPVIPAVYRMGDARLSLFATLAQFGTPDDMTLDDLKIELYFPSDAPTKHALQMMFGDPQTGKPA